MFSQSTSTYWFLSGLDCSCQNPIACIISCMIVPLWLQPLPKETSCWPSVQNTFPTPDQHLKNKENYGFWNNRRSSFLVVVDVSPNKKMNSLRLNMVLSEVIPFHKAKLFQFKRKLRNFYHGFQLYSHAFKSISSAKKDCHKVSELRALNCKVQFNVS